ncbi:MAG: hypothetical protein WC558_10100 [Patulibacter sp.]
MRFSEHYGLTSGQAGLDFVDVDVTTDVTLFIDPYPLRRRTDEWAEGCVGLLQSFFSAVLKTVKADDKEAGVALLRVLREPKETHLGFGRKDSRGSAIGPKIAGMLWDALAGSKAAKSGLLVDLEEAALLVEHVSLDRVSDVCTNVLRRPLIDYTKEQVSLHGVPTERVRSGPIWDPAAEDWGPDEYVDLPVGPEGPILLVPKSIVRQRLTLDPGQYYRHYILERFRDEEIAAGRGLVRVLKDGTRKPYLPKDEADGRLKSQDGSQKRANARITESDEKLLSDYRRDVARGNRPNDPVDLEVLAGGEVDWDGMLAAVLDVLPGREGASVYHRAVRDLLTALFYGELDGVKLEAEIEQGRKRVDLRYTNIATSGFFSWLVRNHAPQPFVWCECKNYTGDLGNESLDQLTGRFAAATRGSFGLLLCRSFEDKSRFVERCREAASAGRGFVLVLDDDDLRTLVLARQNEDDHAVVAHMAGRFAEIVS